jgi:uncharacterized protein involved in exopolysaccharide biosynthesis
MVDTPEETPSGTLMKDARAEGIQYEEVSYVHLANALLRQRRWFAGSVLLIVTVGVAIALLQPHQFAAVSKFVPTTSDGVPSRLSGVVAQFGLGSLGGGGGAAGQSPEFYSALLRSREILEDAVTSQYSFEDRRDGSRSGTYIELYQIRGDSPADVRLKAVEHLRGHLQVSASPSTGLVNVEVQAQWPALAEQVNRRLLELTHTFNIQRRQSQAAAEREFTQRRLEEAGRDLHEAEDALEEFLAANRAYQSSPQLVFEFGRLQRRVDVQQQVVQSLTQAFEQARIDEVRNTPLITMVEEPEGSAHPVAVRRVLAVAALLLGLVLGVIVVAVREYVRSRVARARDEYDEFRRLRGEALTDLNPTTWFGGPRESA